MRLMIRLLGMAVVLLLAAACSTSGDHPRHSPASSKSPPSSAAGGQPATAGAAAQPQEFRGKDPLDFYRPPKPMPAVPHGTLLRFERTRLTVSGGTVWKIMYASKSLSGKRIAVTGIVLVPAGKPPAGGWKLVSAAHGTTGVADDCAPSRGDVALPAGQRTPYPISLLNKDYGAFAEAGYLRSGYVVSLTDYEGLGTPGIHPYLVGQSEARSVLDAARAARQLPAVPVQRRFAIWGYSQGGHAAAWANDVAATWTPELHLVGTVAGGPVSEMTLVANTLATTKMAPSLFFMIIAGYAAAYPQLHPSDVLTPAGLAMLKRFETHCSAAHSAALTKTPMSAFVKPGFTSDTAWQRALSESNPGQPGRPKVLSPLLILHSDVDETVPAFLSDTMFKRMCRLGWHAERRVYHNGKTHVGEVPDALVDGLHWINDRMAGKQAPTNCPTS
ncbi:MAG TPA: lipase family protein [Flexivirga sp.]|uniref:lipase family protein n=1 Tax=Flexivirga sp. TaxID=1962927 RepID=UPI002C2CC060|nr:lipase family protein [Flexivirga sp.]HWC22813.1 lipase family protein [Flexivirga sp.]